VAEKSKRQRCGCLGAQPTGAPAIVLLRAGDGKAPLFLIHGVDGTMRPFRRLLKHLEPDQPIYGVLSQARLGEKKTLMRVEDLAAYYIEAIQSLRLPGPYHFLGYSFGGFLAFEMAQQLYARGELVGMLGMLDNLRMGSSMASSGEPGAVQSVLARRWKQIKNHLGQLVDAGWSAYIKRELRARGLRTIYTILCARGRPIPPFLRRASDMNWFAARNYQPRFYPGRVTLFQAAASARLPQATNGLWARLAGRGVEVVGIPGTHEDILRLHPNAKLLAEAITDCLAGVMRTVPSVE
jgi:thioesterase domain-containing protein